MTSSLLASLHIRDPALTTFAAAGHCVGVASLLSIKPCREWVRGTVRALLPQHHGSTLPAQQCQGPCLSSLVMAFPFSRNKTSMDGIVLGHLKSSCIWSQTSDRWPYELSYSMFSPPDSLAFKLSHQRHFLWPSTHTLKNRPSLRTPEAETTPHTFLVRQFSPCQHRFESLKPDYLPMVPSAVNTTPPLNFVIHSQHWLGSYLLWIKTGGQLYASWFKSAQYWV